jgi:hypothetical protein
MSLSTAAIGLTSMPQTGSLWLRSFLSRFTFISFNSPRARGELVLAQCATLLHLKLIALIAPLH